MNFRTGLIRGLQSAGYTLLVVAPEDPLVLARMAELDVERFALSINRSGLNPLADLRLLFHYRKVLRQARPVAFLSFTVKPNIFGSLAAASLGIPFIPNVSGLGTAFMRNGPLQMLVSNLYRMALRKATTVFFQNPDDRELFVARRIVRQDQARVLPGSGIDLERFSPAARAHQPTNFLLIARLLADKGVREYVDAARLAGACMPQARFQLLGPTDEGNRTGIRRAELERWMREGAIEYLGTTDDVRPFIAAASAIVLPSYREGLPRSLLEGAAMARPLIATDVPGCREVVDEGVNGYLCAARDAGSLAEAMTKFAKLDPAEREAMGIAARRKVQERFSEDIVIRTYLDELARLETLPS